MKRIILLGLALASFFSLSTASAQNYNFLSVTGNNVPGPGATSQFTSSNYPGVINVTHAFSQGGFGMLYDNQNALLFPSGFPTLFPMSGPIQGHLVSTNYNHQSTVTFTFVNYPATDTIFGIWNATNRTSAPPYRLQYVDSNNVLGPPIAFQPYQAVNNNNEDNTLGPAGHQNLDMNLATGVISAGAVLQAGGTHTNAAFWRIPAGTQQIIVHGMLGPSLNGEPDDGVGYYFADRKIPEPAGFVLAAVGAAALAARRKSPLASKTT